MYGALALYALGHLVTVALSGGTPRCQSPENKNGSKGASPGSGDGSSEEEIQRFIVKKGGFAH